MKVAIIGAGISGLSCAYEFKRHGIIPTVFERKSHIGQGFDVTVAALRLFCNTYSDSLKHLNKKYGLTLTPLYRLTEEVTIGPTRQYTVNGSLGYVFKRGTEAFSLENQLAGNAKLSIKFDSYIDIKDIKNDFDYIISATGDSSFAKELGVWTTTLNCFTRVATILGDFKVKSAKIWFNTKFAKNGFCYLLPDSKKLAHLALSVNNISHAELDFYWKEFLFNPDLRYPIIETNDHEESIGFANPVQVGNIYFIGNTAGMIDNFLGFGTVNCIQSGILAAQSIIFNNSYEKMLSPISKNIKAMAAYRDAINAFDNNDYDKLIGLVSLPLIKQLLYNNPLYKAKYGAVFAKLYNMLQG